MALGVLRPLPDVGSWIRVGEFNGIGNPCACANSPLNKRDQKTTGTEMVHPEENQHRMGTTPDSGSGGTGKRARDSERGLLHEPLRAPDDNHWRHAAGFL